MKNENFEQSHSAEIHKKGDPLGFLAHLCAAKYLKNLKVGGPFEGEKKSKKSRTVPKKNLSKKFLANARTRTRDRWVHRKPSKDCTNEYT